MKGKKPKAEKVLAPARKLPAPAEPLLAFFPGPSPKTGPTQPAPGMAPFRRRGGSPRAHAQTHQEGQEEAVGSFYPPGIGTAV